MTPFYEWRSSASGAVFYYFIAGLCCGQSVRHWSVLSLGLTESPLHAALSTLLSWRLSSPRYRSIFTALHHTDNYWYILKSFLFVYFRLTAPGRQGVNNLLPPPLPSPGTGSDGEKHAFIAVPTGRHRRIWRKQVRGRSGGGGGEPRAGRRRGRRPYSTISFAGAEWNLAGRSLSGPGG